MDGSLIHRVHLLHRGLDSTVRRMQELSQALAQVETGATGSSGIISLTSGASHPVLYIPTIAPVVFDYAGGATYTDTFRTYAVTSSTGRIPYADLLMKLYRVPTDYQVSVSVQVARYAKRGSELARLNVFFHGWAFPTAQAYDGRRSRRLNMLMAIPYQTNLSAAFAGRKLTEVEVHAHPCEPRGSQCLSPDNAVVWTNSQLYYSMFTVLAVDRLTQRMHAALIFVEHMQPRAAKVDTKFSKMFRLAHRQDRPPVPQELASLVDQISDAEVRLKPSLTFY